MNHVLKNIWRIKESSFLLHTLVGRLKSIEGIKKTLMPKLVHVFSFVLIFAATGVVAIVATIVIVVVEGIFVVFVIPVVFVVVVMDWGSPFLIGIRIYEASLWVSQLNLREQFGHVFLQDGHWGLTSSGQLNCSEHRQPQ